MKLVNPDNCSVCVVGLGYVGLPLAICISNNKFSYKTKKVTNRNVIGYDKNSKRIKDLSNGIDVNKEVKKSILNSSKNIKFTFHEDNLSDIDIFIVAIPTPIDEFKVPDLSSLKKACITIGKSIKKRKSKTAPVIIFESTVYPGCTEEECIPLIEKHSDLRHNLRDKSNTFYCGYSPERINPGDKKNNIENIIKVVSGCNEEITQIIDLFY